METGNGLPDQAPIRNHIFAYLIHDGLFAARAIVTAVAGDVFFLILDLSLVLLIESFFITSLENMAI